MVTTGQLNRRIRFLQYQLNGQSASGAPQRTWVEGSPTFAQITVKTGAIVEQPAAETTAPILTIQVTVRYRKDVSPRTTRIKLLDEDNRLLEVTSRYDPDGRKRDLVILCTEILP